MIYSWPQAAPDYGQEGASTLSEVSGLEPATFSCLASQSCMFTAVHCLASDKVILKNNANNTPTLHRNPQRLPRSLGINSQPSTIETQIDVFQSHNLHHAIDANNDFATYFC